MKDIWVWVTILAWFPVVTWKINHFSLNIQWMLPALTHVPGGLQGFVRASHWWHPEQTVPWGPAEDCLSVTLWVCVERPVALWQGGQATGWCGDSVKPWWKLLIILLKIRSKWAALISWTKVSLKVAVLYTLYMLIRKVCFQLLHNYLSLLNLYHLYCRFQFKVHVSLLQYQVKFFLIDFTWWIFQFSFLLW